MPLQWLPLQQRQPIPTTWGAGRRPGRSPVSEALTPQIRAAGAMPTGMAAEGFMERERRLQEEEDRRKHELKLLDKQLEIAKFGAGLREDERKGVTPMTAGEALRREPEAPPAEAPTLTEENMPDAAKEMYNLILDMPDETQSVLLNQLFAPTTPTGTIATAGRQVTMPPKYNDMANVFLSKGWATIGEGGRPVLSEPEREFEKGTFEIVEEGGIIYQLNTATGERKKIGTVDEPGGVVNEINKQANADALALAKADPDTTFEDAKHDALIDYGVNEEVAIDMAKVKGIPKGDEGKGLIERFINWVKGEQKLPEGWAPKGAGVPGAGAGAFDETNVTSLVPVISDDVTEAERAHLKGQGASDADINEAIKRKAGE